MIKQYYKTTKGLYGPAIDYTIIDSEGRMWVGNDEYESQVNYCPMTGKAAPIQLEVLRIANNGVDVYGSSDSNK